MITIKRQPSSSYVSYQRGDIPLVLTVPHGGYTGGKEIPDRPEKGGNVLVNDGYTVDTARLLSEYITDYYGSRPYMVICNVRRRKVDVNRPLDLSTESAEGQAVWKEYHQTVQRAVNEIRARHKQQGLLLDIHGHSRHDLVMLGYLLHKNELIQLQDDRNRTDQAVLKKSSIQTLAARISIPEHPSELLRGDGSFGELMEYSEETVKAVPSSSHPAPLQDEFYYSGGYTTHAYHKNDSNRNGLDVIQIELPRYLRLTPDQRQVAARAITGAVTYWLDQYYQPVILDKAKL
ncbi:hypothetical protein BDB00DRAFT_809207 [Zychaea mexicana]|uniref:uncharacterized protein n=1 Tax=Zychaea mexicana TaxID=64656 RepID=UPI0022FF0CA6|nr:uncharacterized protein BDB00DRAFT_809207 [Zychaea mexicana]KAI9496529.1 hypothetical protein BDB00DRAFT_809207 [Zychaea mexicana]